jgi:hypothetical protein
MLGLLSPFPQWVRADWLTPIFSAKSARDSTSNFMNIVDMAMLADSIFDGESEGIGMARNKKVISGLEEYTPQEIKNLAGNARIKIATSEEHIRSFIDDALISKNRGEKLLLGKIDNELGGRIEYDTGVNLRGYHLELRSNEIKHIILKHGSESTEISRGQRAIIAEDIYNFVDIVTKYDAAVCARDGSLHFSKNINGKVTAVTVHANKSRSLSLQTMYAGRKKAGG